MNKLLIKARSIARRTGLKRLYHRLAPQHDYEEAFREAILSELRPGDVIWDIGANRGYYTKIFGEKTGPNGRVIAFEPTPESHADLRHKTAQYPWVRCEQMALSDFDGSSLFVVGKFDTTNHLQYDANGAVPPNGMRVPVMRGDSYWKASGVTPNKVKIDVEGFEDEVLTGMGNLLDAPELRAIFMEVHFMLLEERGRADAPIRMEELLRSKGMRTKWVDMSHLVAIRIKA